MTCDIQQFRQSCALLGLHPEACAEYIEVYKDICSNVELTAIIVSAADILFDPAADRDESAKLVSVSADKRGGNKYALYAVFFVMQIPRLKYEYERAGLAEQIFEDTVRDISIKTDECRQVNGCWGIEPLYWYAAIFRREIIALGRLQYAYTTYGGGDILDNGNVVIKHGDKILNIHIPSSGYFGADVRQESYRLAYEFFAGTEYIRDGKLMAICESWLMYNKYREVFREGSNLRGFMDELNHLESWQTEEFSNFWRIFGNKDGVMTDDTALRRAFIQYINAGGKPGTGRSLLIFDGQKACIETGLRVKALNN